jgi:hypothetical protein
VRPAAIAAVVALAVAGGLLELARTRHHGPAAPAHAAARHRPTTRPARERVVRHRRARPSPAALALGLPSVPAGPVPGYVLIADRNANKLLIVSPSKKIVWQFPRPGDLRSGQSFSDPDDAFFTPDYHRIVTNEEFNDAIAQIDLRRRRIVWTYGRAGVAGSAAGELSNPDDAYVWPNGTITVADIRNCRVLRLNRAGRTLAEIGGSGCTHDPPRALASPNGATPLADGGMLVTEIGGWVDRLDARGRLVFAVRTPTSYPSDAQLLPNGHILVAGFDTPGRVDEITSQGQVVWTYGPSSGPGALDRPSLAVRWPNGMIAITDDWHHRIVVVDPRTNRIVWQYGHFGIPSSDSGYLSKPDGLDLLPAARAPAAQQLRIRRIGSLPTAGSRFATAALPGRRLLLAGGLVAGTSSPQLLAGAPEHLRPVGTLPVATHDAALTASRSGGLLFGGGEAVSTDAVVRIDLRTRAARRVASLGEPLSDLGAAVVGGRIYLVGGYTGTRYATAVLRFRPGKAPAVVARLPIGLRYAGVTALGGRIYVAGGLTTAGESRSVFAVDPERGRVRLIATLPGPVAHAPLAALDGALWLIGGADETGGPLDRILRIDPVSGAVAVAGHLPQPLADAAAVTVGRRVIVLGGTTPAPSRAIFAISR